MQAVILAAGASSRFFPYSENKHKSMVSFFGKPIIVHTIESLKKAGISDIIIVVNKSSNLSEILKGFDLGVSIDIVKRNKALGMGDALLSAKNKLNNNFFVLHAYHVDAGEIISQMLKKTKSAPVLSVKSRMDYWNHGVVKIADNKITDVLEKPEKDKDLEKLCLIGIYYLSKSFINILLKTPLKHYQFEDALSLFAKQNPIPFYTTTQTVSLKYPWDLLSLKDYLSKSFKDHRGKNLNIAKTSEIIGECFIGDNVTIREGSRIKGPCFIGNNVQIGTNAILRNGSVVEDACVVGAQMEVKNSILMKGSTTHSGFIGDSIIGEGCKIAANFITANVRLDRQSVKVKVKNDVIDSALKSLGVMMGDGVKVGVQSSTMPGVIIGNDTVIGPSTVVKQNVTSQVSYYSEFKGIVEEKRQ